MHWIVEGRDAAPGLLAGSAPELNVHLEQEKTPGSFASN